MKRCLADIPRPDFRLLKDACIRESMREFIRSHSGKALPPRETEFRPEILIPCFNHGRYLPLALASNTMPAIPVTVIDDASTDDTAAILESLQAKFNLKVIRNEKNLLQSGSLNKAIAGSPNNLFIILNADDLLLPYALDVIFKVLREDAEVRLVGGGAVRFSQDATLALMNVFPRALDHRPSYRRAGPEQAWSFSHPNDINMTFSGSAFFRSAWEAVGGFKPFEDRVCSHDDRDFEMRVAALFQVAVVDEPVAFVCGTRSTQRGQS